MFADARSLSRWFALLCVLAISLVLAGTAFAQSTATILVRNQNTGEERSVQTDSSGAYVVPSLPVGTYRIEAKAPGMQSTVATNLELEVGRTVRQDFSL